MDWKSIGTMVASVAPTLGTILGGPVGTIVGAAGSMLASALDVEETPEAVATAIKNDPDAMTKIKQIEADKAVELKRLEEQTTQSYYQGQAAVYEAQAKADGQSTRPKIALIMAWMLVIPYVLIGVALGWAIYSDPTVISDMWTVLAAYLGIPLTVLKMYFGELRREQGQRLGTAPTSVIGTLLGGSK